MGPDMVLGYTHSEGFVESYANGLLIQEARSRRTLSLTSLASAPQDLFIATRMMLTDVFNALRRARSLISRPCEVVRLRDALRSEAGMLEALRRRSSDVWPAYREQLAANRTRSA